MVSHDEAGSHAGGFVRRVSHVNNLYMKIVCLLNMNKIAIVSSQKKKKKEEDK